MKLRISERSSEEEGEVKGIGESGGRCDAVVEGRSEQELSFGGSPEFGRLCENVVAMGHDGWVAQHHRWKFLHIRT